MELFQAKAGRVPPARSGGHEVRVWALMALLGAVTLFAGWILWAKISGF